MPADLLRPHPNLVIMNYACVYGTCVWYFPTRDTSKSFSALASKTNYLCGMLFNYNLQKQKLWATRTDFSSITCFATIGLPSLINEQQGAGWCRKKAFPAHFAFIMQVIAARTFRGVPFSLEAFASNCALPGFKWSRRYRTEVFYSQLFHHTPPVHPNMFIFIPIS